MPLPVAPAGSRSRGVLLHRSTRLGVGVMPPWAPKYEHERFAQKSLYTASSQESQVTINLIAKENKSVLALCLPPRQPSPCELGSEETTMHMAELPLNKLAFSS